MLNKRCSNTFSLTAQSILGLTVAIENMMVLSRGLSALWDEKCWCSTLNQWMDGWRRCQSSLCSEATAISYVCLYLDDLATFHEIEIRCSFKAFIDSTDFSFVVVCNTDEDFYHLLTCSHSGALKTRYDASDTLRKAIKSHVAGPSLMKAIRCWTKDPS
jgi:hypothetical protein